MKKIIRRSIFLLLTITYGLFSQAPAPKSWIFGTSPFQDSLWAIDTTTWQVVQRMAPSLNGYTITGITGMAYDPTTFQTYIVAKISGVSGRVLCKMDPYTGICDSVGNLGTNFSSITFHNNGQLYGATGNGATPSESLFLINKNDGDTTFLYQMGNGADGEIICFNRADTMIYHWSGNGTVIYEKFSPSDTTYNPTNIVVTGTPLGETFGALYNKPNEFIRSNISSSFNYCSTNGFFGSSLINTPDDLRGLVMVPDFTYSNDTICEEVDTFYVGAGNLQLYDSVIYHWGDGVVEAMGTVGASHIYNAPGSYTVAILLDNGVIRDTITTYVLEVLNIPNVTLSGNVKLCPNDSVTLTGSSGGTSQWFMDGVLISGATNNTYKVGAPGIYNMMKYNLNGCGDSASVGLVVYSVPSGSVNLGPDTTACGSFILDAMNPGGTYLWSTGSTQQMITATVTATYDVSIADSNGCAATDTVMVEINNLPIVSLSASSYTVCASDPDVTLTGTPSSGTYSGGSVTGNMFDPSVGTGSHQVYYSYTDTNSCTTIDTITITVNACTGINENNSMLVSRIYPNPSTGIILLEVNRPGTSVEITDILGNTIFVQQVISQGTISVDMSMNARGTYLVIVSSPEGERNVSRIALIGGE